MECGCHVCVNPRAYISYTGDGRKQGLRWAQNVRDIAFYGEVLGAQGFFFSWNGTDVSGIIMFAADVSSNTV